MDLSLLSMKTNYWSADNFKKTSHPMSCTTGPAIQSGDTSQWITILAAVN